MGCRRTFQKSWGSAKNFYISQSNGGRICPLGVWTRFRSMGRGSSSLKIRQVYSVDTAFFLMQGLRTSDQKIFMALVLELAFCSYSEVKPDSPLQTKMDHTQPRLELKVRLQEHLVKIYRVTNSVLLFLGLGFKWVESVIALFLYFLSTSTCEEPEWAKQAHSSG